MRGDNTLRVRQISTQRSYSVLDELLSGDVEGKTIAKLVECLHTIDSDDDSAYPMELDTILDKNALFKVTVLSHNIEQHVEVYTVLKIYDDEELTKQFQPSSSDYNLPKEASTTRSVSHSWYKTMISDSDYAEFDNFSKWLKVSQ
ncbi:hypothetical protein BC332_01024 [Capsicum chinense]|nr:hypothetical protein BC332_01024 [Capsicum chinense]